MREEPSDKIIHRKKGYRYLLVAACVFLAIEAAVYASLVIRNSRGAGETEYELLIDATADEITGITYSAADGSILSFVRSGSIWTLDPAKSMLTGEIPAAEALDQEKIRRFVSGVTGVAVQSVIENPESLEEYGLDEPYTEAVVKYGDGTETKLGISASSGSSGLVYVLKNGDAGKVLVCLPSIKNNFEKNLSDFLAEDAAESGDS